jgi:hypothetical protein
MTALLPENYITLAAVLMNLLLAGSVHITSNQPDEKPRIDTKYILAMSLTYKSWLGM